MPIETLGPVRHRCDRSGGCCEGHMVRVTPEEEARIVGLAPGLGVAEPVVDSAPGLPRVLRREAGRCVFLAADGCRVHRAHGADAKPAICRQYPLVAVRVGDAVRVGVDAGCLSAWATWQSGPKLESPGLVVSRVENQDAWIPIEAAILEATRKLRVPELVRRLTGDDVAVFAAATKERARRADLPERLAHPDVAAPLRTALAGLDRLLEAPLATLDAQVDAYVREMVRRMVWLRLTPHTPHPVAGARLALAGAVLLGPLGDIRRFGPAFAAWTRVVRERDIAAALLGAG